MDYCKEVGERIRLYRKRCGYTLVDLANLINKSKSIVSKYERGEVAIDILTIRQIAQTLNVPVSSLLDEDLTHGAPLFRPDDSVDFNRSCSVKTSYVYSYFSHENKPILRVQQIQHADDKAVVYFYPDHIADGKSFECYYTGAIVKESSFTRILVSNPVVPDDILIMDFPARFHKHNPVLGYITSISIPPYSPLASMAILSDVPVTDTEWLKSKLTLDKEFLKRCRKVNCFVIPLECNYHLNLNTL
ncbi:helix-turn-helix domain-containing protein [bacterium 210820-DFI.6.37]|nr:helix-turn-helix domain-containing protein [bacterium 210820-DFI.6.37]